LTQSTQQTQNVVNECRSLHHISIDIDYVDLLHRTGQISYQTWHSKKGTLQDEYTRCDPRLQ